TYDFDQVLGPNIDQEQTFHLVMGPMIEEILSGFNCTVFAYGQTGTGKTYTMQGNVDNRNQTITSESGLIPRTLDHLLRTLSQSGIEFSLKISMIELYNEEVTDLLTPSEAKPLHLYQDPQKGLIIPKLEEFPITSVDQAMKKLQLGINRRHIAATKINEHSSRSHCIFTITAHMKELTLEGEEVLKIGKLNLVDLAGSENIGKSGVQENIRLREVSNINTSLFTLGRVINALVVNASHVPYRESKLTRLLQDSLGGHTKTCIVATVNPCQSNLDVTLATLDYVKKAMQIRNKPQVNQVLSKKKLLMDYTQEICTLKNQL
ncbi:kinesin-domain-containing protein, partial [Conidiobolus coronatus NRRL 28638]